MLQYHCNNAVENIDNKEKKLTAAKPAAREPSSDGHIIEAQRQPSQHHAAHYHQQRLPPASGERIGLRADEERVEKVEERVVDDVERIREVAKKAIQAHPAGRDRTLRRAQPKHGREQHNDAHSLEKTIPAHGGAAGNVGHHRHKQHQHRSQDKRATHSHRTEAARHEHTKRVGERHAQQTAPEVHPIKRPAYAEHTHTERIAHKCPRQQSPLCGSKQGKHARAETVEEERIENVADILKEQRPRGPIEGEHLAIAAHLTRASRHGGQHQHGGKQSQHGMREGHAAAIPLPASLHQKGHQAHNGGQNHHGMKTDHAAAEETGEAETAPPTVVIGIADDETRKQEEEVHSQIAMIEMPDRAIAHAVYRLGKGKALEDMMKNNEQGGHPAQSIEQLVVRLGVGKARCEMALFFS